MGLRKKQGGEARSLLVHERGTTPRDRDGSGPRGPAVSTGSPRLQYFALVAAATVVTSGALRLGVAPLLVMSCAIVVAVLFLMTRLALVVHDARRARRGGGLAP